MGIVIRQSLKSTFVTYAGVVIGTFNVLWLYPKFFSTDEVGLIRLLQDIPTIMAVFLQLGAANLSDRFFAHFKDDTKKHNGILFILLTYPLIGFSIFCGYYYFYHDYLISFYKDNSPLLSEYFSFIIPIGFFMMYASVLEAYCRANLRIVVPSIVREIFLRLFMAAITILYAVKIISFTQLMYLFCIMYGISMLLLIVYLKQLKKLYLKPDYSLWNPTLISEMRSFILYIIPGTAGSLIATKIDTLMLASMTNLSFTGIYSVAFYIGTIVEIPKRALSQITIPFINSYWKENDLKGLNILYKKTSTNLFAMGMFSFLLIWCNIDGLFNFIPNSEIYRSGKYVVLFIGFSKIFDLLTSINGELILYSKYYRFNLVLIVALTALTVLTNLWLIPIYDIEGAALALMLTIFIFNVIKTFFLYIKFNLHPFTTSTIKIIAISALCYFASQLLPSGQTSNFQIIIYIFLKCVFISMIYLSFAILLNVSEDINSLSKAIYSGITRFFIKERT